MPNSVADAAAAMAQPAEISTEQEARLRGRLQVRLDAGEWHEAETLLTSWLRQFGYQQWMVEQLGHLRLRRAALRDAGQSFFWAGVRGPQVERALEAYLITTRRGRRTVSLDGLPSWVRGAFERYPEVVQRELAAMGVQRRVLEPGAPLAMRKRRERLSSWLGLIFVGFVVAAVVQRCCA